MFLPENLGKHCQEWPAGKTESEIKHFIQENSKPQNLTDGSVTKGQSGWGFTVKQGATTIHEDSAALTVPTSGLTREVEAVTHALRWISSKRRQSDHTSHYPLRFNVPGTKLESGTGSPEWYVLVFDMQVGKLLLAFCPDHVWVKGNGRADRPAGKATTASGLCCGTSEVPRR